MENKTVYPELFSRKFGPIDRVNGFLGTLFDARSIIVSEVINGEFSITIEYPLNAPLSPSFQLDDWILSPISPPTSIMYEGKKRPSQLFRIHEIEEDWNTKTLYIYGEQILSDLKRMAVRASTITNQPLNLGGFKVINIAEYQAGTQPLLLKFGTTNQNRFAFATDMPTKRPPNTQTQFITNFGTLADAYFGDTNSIMSVYGGGEMFKNNERMEMNQSAGVVRNDIQLRLDFNVSGFKITKKLPIATRILPFMRAQVSTVPNSDTAPTVEKWIGIKGGVPSQLDDYIKSPNEGVYSDMVCLPVEYTPMQDFPYSHIGMAQTELWGMSQSYYNTERGKENALPRYTYEIDFRALSEGSDWGNHLKHVYPLLPQIQLGDIVPIILDDETGETVNVKCTEYEYNVLARKYNKLVLGTVNQDFTTTLARTFNPQAQNN